jgi:hypothetical protein
VQRLYPALSQSPVPGTSYLQYSRTNKGHTRLLFEYCFFMHGWDRRHIYYVSLFDSRLREETTCILGCKATQATIWLVAAIAQV